MAICDDPHQQAARKIPSQMLEFDVLIGEINLCSILLPLNF